MATVAETLTDLIDTDKMENAKMEGTNLDVSSPSAANKIDALSGASQTDSDISANPHSDIAVTHTYNGNFCCFVLSFLFFALLVLFSGQDFKLFVFTYLLFN